jgi:hypothetical protein
MTSARSPLWVITSYFNPANYARRLRNFKAFRRLLDAPLLVVELAAPGAHQLTRDDADIVVSLTGEDGLWQKERLLNLACSELPAHVDYVAWIDSDLVFEDRDWPSQAIARLEADGGMLQLFDTVLHLPPQLAPETAARADCRQAEPMLAGVAIARSVASQAFEVNERKLSTARLAPDLASYNRVIDHHNCYGMAWAAARKTLDRCGLYDRNVIGGGDAVHAFAALSGLDAYWSLRANTPAQKDDIRAWAQSAGAAGLFARLDSLPGRAYHLWHGSLRNRGYRNRYDILSRHDFDPGRDLVKAANGAWAWRDPDSAMARDVRDYFFSRREDEA